MAILPRQIQAGHQTGTLLTTRVAVKLYAERTPDGQHRRSRRSFLLNPSMFPLDNEIDQSRIFKKQ
jgi:hypothetical protein